MSTSPEAKQAAEEAGYPPNKVAHYTWCEGYDAATAKLREELSEVDAKRLQVEQLYKQLAHQQPSATTPERPCSCHPDDNPPVPCAEKYALSECKATPDVLHACDYCGNFHDPAYSDCATDSQAQKADNVKDQL